MQFAVEMQFFDNFGTVSLEPTIHVVEFHAGKKCRDAVEAVQSEQVEDTG